MPRSPQRMIQSFRAKAQGGQQLDKIKEKKVNLHSDTAGNEPKKSASIDSTLQNKYGDLLKDRPSI